MRMWSVVCAAGLVMASGCASLETRTYATASPREVVVHETAPTLVTTPGGAGPAAMRCVKVVHVQRYQETESRYETRGVGSSYLTAGLLAGAGVLLLAGSQEASAQSAPVLSGLGEVALASGEAVAAHTDELIEQSLRAPTLRSAAVSVRARVVTLDPSVCAPPAPTAPSARWSTPTKAWTAAEAQALAAEHIAPRIDCETRWEQTHYRGGALHTRAQRCAGGEGQLMGNVYTYYGDGVSIKQIESYHKGIPDGYWFQFDFLGKVKSEALYRDGLFVDPALSAQDGNASGEVPSDDAQITKAHQRCFYDEATQKYICCHPSKILHVGATTLTPGYVCEDGRAIDAAALD